MEVQNPIRLQGLRVLPALGPNGTIAVSAEFSDGGAVSVDLPQPYSPENVVKALRLLARGILVQYK